MRRRSPAIEDWYIRRQLRNYQQRIRGARPGGHVRRADGADGPNGGGSRDAGKRNRVHRDVAGQSRRRSRWSATSSAGASCTQLARCAMVSDGEGRWGTNAPRLAGMTDWYLVRQLENFKARVRGGHPAGHLRRPDAHDGEPADCGWRDQRRRRLHQHDPLNDGAPKRFEKQ